MTHIIRDAIRPEDLAFSESYLQLMEIDFPCWRIDFFGIAAFSLEI